MSKSLTTPAAISSTQRQHEALDLRLQGYPVRQIAQIIGVEVSSVYRMISTAVKGAREQTQDLYDEFRDIESERLDMLYRTAWEIASDPAKEDDVRLRAINTCNSLIDRRCKMLGLNRPVPLEVIGPNGTKGQALGTIADVLRLAFEDQGIEAEARIVEPN